MISYSDTAKSLAIKKMFDDAYKSEMSCLVVDDIETLMGIFLLFFVFMINISLLFFFLQEYAPIGPRFSNLVLQTLKILFKKQPPKGRKLRLIPTTNEKDLMKDLGLYQTFSKVIHVSNVSRGTEIMSVVEQLDCFSKLELDYLEKNLKDKT